MSDIADTEETLFPFWEERSRLEKHKAITGRVHVSARVEAHDETVSTGLARDEVEVVRVPVGIRLDEPAKMRREDATLIMPMVEEKLCPRQTPPP